MPKWLVALEWRIWYYYGCILAPGIRSGALVREEVNIFLNKYETIFIVNAELTEEARAPVIERFKSMIESNGQLESIDEWGSRRLAYPINDMLDGYYVLATYSAPPEFPSELERVFKITDSILKFLIIRKDG